MKILIILFIGLLIAGCAGTVPIQKAAESRSNFADAFYGGHDFYKAPVKIEGERYRVFEQASTGFVGTAGIRQTATDRANEFCRQKNPLWEMRTVSEHTAIPPYILGNFPRIEIIFVCAVPVNPQD
jgi:hypothetical protein